MFKKLRDIVLALSVVSLLTFGFVTVSMPADASTHDIGTPVQTVRSYAAGGRLSRMHVPQSAFVGTLRNFAPTSQSVAEARLKLAKTKLTNKGVPAATADEMLKSKDFGVNAALASLNTSKPSSTKATCGTKSVSVKLKGGLTKLTFASASLSVKYCIKVDKTTKQSYVEVLRDPHYQTDTTAIGTAAGYYFEAPNWEEHTTLSNGTRRDAVQIPLNSDFLEWPVDRCIVELSVEITTSGKATASNKNSHC